MAGEIPDIKIIIGSDGDSVNTDSVQGPLQVSEPLIVKPANTDDVVVTPVTGDVTPPDHLGVLRGSDYPIAALRAVTQLANGKIVHLDPSIDAHKLGYLGITQNAAKVGRKATVVTQGLMVSSEFPVFTLGPVHSTTDGVLTQDITADTFQVGIAIAPNQLKIGIATAAASGGIETTSYNRSGSVWTINHGLQRFPVVTLFDINGEIMLADVTHVNINTVQVNFAYPTTGTAHLV